MEKFVDVFKKHCAESQCKTTPVIKLMMEEKKHIIIDSDCESLPELMVVFGKQDKLSKVTARNTTLYAGLIEAFGKTISQDYPGLKVLKLEFCQLEGCHIIQLHHILQLVPTITEVSVNGNNISEQNYFLLTQNNSVLNLSLKFCSITSIGLGKLSKELQKPESKLLHLNLSTNQCYDEGIVHIVKFLRVNRTMISLNLADCKISCEGCVALMVPFRKFKLTDDEIAIRRRIRMECLRQAAIRTSKQSSQSKISTYSQDSRDTDKTKKPKKRTSASSADSKRRPSLNSGKRSTASETTKASGTPMPEISKATYHPFVHDSFDEGKEIYCIGNSTLIHLNLSYNNIQKVGLEAISKTLLYQLDVFPDKGGIQYLPLQGNSRYNSWTTYSYLFAEIEVYVNARKLPPEVRKERIERSLSLLKKSPEPSDELSLFTDDH